MLTPDPSTEAPHFTDKNGEDTCNRVAAFWEDRAKREHAWVHRLEDEIAALAARLSQAEEAIRACIGDAEGQEAVREHKMLELTKGQVQLLAAALAASSAGGENA